MHKTYIDSRTHLKKIVHLDESTYILRLVLAGVSRCSVGQSCLKSVRLLNLFLQGGVGWGWQTDINAVLVAGDGATCHVGDEAARGQAKVSLDVHEGLW